ncbi:hypothetical protein [Chitinilyticum litopenaei]|uniref:hypothetical protein n=1 Tax=Chitinilyticum litopenaei TaxID=1121276 RepID=UPI00040A35EB|nr:hypothetical protein [Chitinilyticum litopenaei]
MQAWLLLLLLCAGALCLASLLRGCTARRHDAALARDYLRLAGRHALCVALFLPLTLLAMLMTIHGTALQDVLLIAALLLGWAVFTVLHARRYLALRLRERAVAAVDEQDAAP